MNFKLPLIASLCLFFLVTCSSSSDDPSGIRGCTDPESLTFNPDATEDDGSCIYDLAVSCDEVDFLYTPEVRTFNGVENGVTPGSVIGIEAGVYERIIFEDLVGTSENPVFIVNCGGRVEVGNPEVNNAIIINNSSFVRISGAGDTQNHEYGIYIKGSRRGTQGIVTPDFSTNIEIDHFEIMGAGFAGIMVKTDPSCEAETSAERGGENRVGSRDFVMRGISVHDNYIHDVVGEGIYIGNSFYSGAEVYCGFVQYPHEVRGVRVYNNTIERTGWDAIQVGSAVEDVQIYDNVVTDYALENRASHRNGIQIGVGTTGEVYGNWIESGQGPGVFIQGIGGNYVYNNVIIDAGLHSIIISNRPTPLANDIVNQDFVGGIYIMNNTIINRNNSINSVFREAVNDAPENIFHNNLIIFSDVDNWSELKTTTEWSLVSNLILADGSSAGFVNFGRNNFELISESGAVDTGTNAVREYGVNVDFDGVTRPQGEGYDVGAYESH